MNQIRVCICELNGLRRMTGTLHTNIDIAQKSFLSLSSLETHEKIFRTTSKILISCNTFLLPFGRRKVKISNFLNFFLLFSLYFFVRLDSVLVWRDVAQSASCFVTPCGQQTLRLWIQASINFNKFMICGNICDAYKQFYIACNSFKAILCEIQDNDVLKKRFQLTYGQFGGLLNDGLEGITSLSDISNYMAYAHGPFTTAISERINSTLKCCNICPAQITADLSLSK